MLLSTNPALPIYAHQLGFMLQLAESDAYHCNDCPKHPRLDA